MDVPQSTPRNQFGKMMIRFLISSRTLKANTVKEASDRPPFDFLDLPKKVRGAGAGAGGKLDGWHNSQPCA